MSAILLTPAEPVLPNTSYRLLQLSSMLLESQFQPHNLVLPVILHVRHALDSPIIVLIVQMLASYSMLNSATHAEQTVMNVQS
jgi:hypothetical protein